MSRRAVTLSWIVQRDAEPGGHGPAESGSTSGGIAEGGRRCAASHSRARRTVVRTRSSVRGIRRDICGWRLPSQPPTSDASPTAVVPGA